MSDGRLDLLLQAARNVDRIVILTHNDPDPDAIASAVALRFLLKETLGAESTIVYKGIVGRAENRALVEYLQNPLRRLTSRDLRAPAAIALMDTQPGTGNNALPAGTVPVIVLDHHPWREATASARFADVRPELGATCTILTEYLQSAGLEIDPSLATALFYGIKADTLGLVRGAAPADLAAYTFLQPRIDVDALVEIESAQEPAEYFRRLDATLHAARIYGDLVVSYVGSMDYPDLAAAMADLLLRLRGARWAIAMGAFNTELIVAVRTRHHRGGAGRLVQVMVGDLGTAGGHGTMAGGQIPLRGRDPEVLAYRLARRARQHLEIPAGTRGKPLI